MTEKAHSFQKIDQKVIEKIIDEDVVNINHMVLPQGERLPQHYTNSNVFMIVSRGMVTLILNDSEPHSYIAGNIIEIPYNTKMDVLNNHPDVLELFVVKAPGPKAYRE